MCIYKENSSVETVPYFYIIRNKETGIMYAGSKWVKGSHPDNFMIPGGYTTSSNTVNNIIKKVGLDIFEILRIDTYCDDIHVLKYETVFLKTNDCANSNEWYNKHNNGHIKIYHEYCNIQLVTPTNEIIFVEDLFLYCKENNINYKQMKLLCRKLRKSYHGYRLLENIDYIPAKLKCFKFITPEGNLIEIEDLYQFCEDNKLNRRHMIRVFKCQEKSHHGYTSYYKKDSPELIEILDQYSSKVDRNYSFIKTENQKEYLKSTLLGSNNPCAKKFTAISPEGKKYYLHGNLYSFCEEHGLKSPYYVSKCIKLGKKYKNWEFFDGHI